MIHISRDNNIILSKDLPLFAFFNAVIKFEIVKVFFLAGAVREKALRLGQSVDLLQLCNTLTRGDQHF